MDRQAQGRQGARALRRRQRAVPPQLRLGRRRGGAVAGRGHRAQRRPARQRLSRPWPETAGRSSPRSSSAWRCARASSSRPALALLDGVGPLLRPDRSAPPRSQGRERHADRRAGRERRADRGHLGPARDAGARGVDRARDGVPGVEALQHRARRPRLARPLPAAPVAGLGHAGADPRPGTTRSTRSTTPWPRSTATSRCGSPRRRRQVQRSGFPEAYADHEADARVLASALTGRPRAAAFCVRHRRRRRRVAERRSTTSGLTAPRGRRARGRPGNAFGELALGGFAPGRGDERPHGGVRALRRPRDRHLRAARSTTANKARGWAIAQYLVAQADRLDDPDGHLRRPDLDRRAAARRGLARLRPARDARATAAILEHRDHVHVDVVD